MKLEAMNRSLVDRQKNVRQLGAHFSGNRNTQIIGETAGDSSRQVERFIRLNKLTPDPMQLVDDGRLKTTPAVGSLSYLTPEVAVIFSLTWKRKGWHTVIIPSAEAESCQQGKCSDERQDSRDHVCPFPQRKAARTAAHDCRIQGRTLFPEGLYLRTDGKYHPETSGKLPPQAAGLRTMRWRYDKSFDYRTGLLPLSGCL